jgi:hypothetical protein
MDVTIGIQRDRVLREVNRLTAFTARQIEGKFDRIAATTDEEKIVLSYMDQAISEMVGKLAGYSPIAGDDELSFCLPVTFDRLMIPAASDAIVNYLVHEICDRWFAVTKPDEKTNPDAGSVLFFDIVKLLCTRNKPLER